MYNKNSIKIGEDFFLFKDKELAEKMLVQIYYVEKGG